MPEPWVCFEDDHLLVVRKPAGVNTHRADALAQDGMHEWVQRQRPQVSLSILHRLDKATSGLLLFGKTDVANRSLARQFDERAVTKRYELLVRRDERRAGSLRCDQPIEQSSRGARPLTARTDFERQATGTAVERFAAWPHTGRTHQVRVHAAALAMPILGDVDHGGDPAARLFLHAAALGFEHPLGGPVDLEAPAPPSFDAVLAGADPDSPSVAARAADEARRTLFDPGDTDAFLWIDRHHDGFPEVRVERLADVAVVLDYRSAPSPLPPAWLEALDDVGDLAAIYQQRRPRGGASERAVLVSGAARPRFVVTELGSRFLIDLEVSATSTGLFLDQRETRRRLASTDLTGKTVLNVFAHTGSLSVAAARAGADTVTLDLSRRYLDWARENFRLNDLDPDAHDFIYGDALLWMDRLAKKGRTFDVVLVDPPSSSTTGKRGGTRWVADRDLAALVERGAQLCAPDGTLFVSVNLHRLRWARFLDHVQEGVAAAGRTAHVETQTLPLDHRSGPGDPPYLKAAWIRLDG